MYTVGLFWGLFGDGGLGVYEYTYYYRGVFARGSGSGRERVEWGVGVEFFWVEVVRGIIEFIVDGVVFILVIG